MTVPLLTQWRASLPSDVPPAPADAAGAELVARWSEPGRRYHTVDHLVFMLAVIDESADLADDPDAVRLAAWFHDAIYDPTDHEPGRNERRSADLAATMLPPLGVPASRVAEVGRLVLLTADHRVEDGDSNGAVLADADLAILATDPPTYRLYAQLVRAEYAHVPDGAFRAGRSAVLTKLLDLDALFHLAPHRERWEARARANVTAELAALASAGANPPR